jgi:hypothetical protein
MDATNSDSDAPELARVFAPMLSELEDHATRLTARQAEIARELAAVDEELARVESVRAAMLGKRGPGRPRGSGQPSSSRRVEAANKQTRERAAMVMGYARKHDGEFTGREFGRPLGHEVARHRADVGRHGATWGTRRARRRRWATALLFAVVAERVRMRTGRGRLPAEMVEVMSSAPDGYEWRAVGRRRRRRLVVVVRTHRPEIRYARSG